jgi:hypothetical protein
LTAAAGMAVEGGFGDLGIWGFGDLGIWREGERETGRSAGWCGFWDGDGQIDRAVRFAYDGDRVVLRFGGAGFLGSVSPGDTKRSRNLSME